MTPTTIFFLLATAAFAWLALIWSSAGTQSVFKLAFAAMAVFGLVLTLAAFGFIIAPGTLKL